MAVPFGLSTTFYITLADGQSVTILYGWVLVSLISLAIAASLAEICAVYPTAGGVYYWSAMLATREWAPITSWITGWLTLVGNWTVTLDAEPPLLQMKAALNRITKGQFSIASGAAEADPDFLLVHDRRDGACWLWRFEYGLRFVETIDPVSNDDRGTGQAGNRKLLGP